MLARIVMVCAMLYGAAAASADPAPDAGSDAETETGPDTDTGTGTETGTGTGSGTETVRAPDGDSVRIGGWRRAAAVTLAIVPGVAARGLGSHVAVRPRARNKLLAIGGIGLGAAAIGGVPVGATYGSGKVVVPGVHLAVAGTGLIVASWLTDIYSAAGGDRLGGRPRLLPGLSAELGALWQYNGYVGHRVFAVPAVDVRGGRFGARVSGLVAHDGSAFGTRVDGEARVWSRTHGDRVARARHNGTFLAVRGAVQLHDEVDQGFVTLTSEFAVRGRLDLGRVDVHLRGAYLELEEGLGLEMTDYDAASIDTATVLLSRFGWGIYLPGGRGELGVFYDHRRDHLAGGFPAGPAAGFFGSLGGTGEIVLTPRWTLAGSLELGSSVLTTLTLRREVP